MSIPNPPFGLLSNAPMQTQLVDNQRSVTPPWGGWLNFLRQWLFLNIPTVVTSSSGVSVSSDPIANGAVGDGIHDDTAILQQTWNQTGVLYLRPGKRFATSATLVSPGNNFPLIQLIYGGGQIVSSAATGVSFTSSGTNIIISQVVILAGTTALSIANNGSEWIVVDGCFISAPTTVALNSNHAQTVRLTNNTFNSSATAVSLTTQTDVLIAACEFIGTGSVVSTSGTCTYNVVGCNVQPHFGAPVLNQYAEFTGTTQTITAGPSFVNVTSCSFTVSATGTWQISANAFVQQAAAVANTATIRFTRNGTGDTHTAASGSPAAGEFMLHFDTQIALTSGDTIQLQCLATTANVTLLGTGSSGTTNISGVFLTT